MQVQESDTAGDLVLSVLDIAGHVDGGVKLVKLLQAANYLHYKRTGVNMLDIRAGSFGEFDGELHRLFKRLEREGLIRVERERTMDRYHAADGAGGRAVTLGGGVEELVRSLAPLPYTDVMAAVCREFPELTAGGGAGTRRRIRERLSYLPAAFELDGWCNPLAREYSIPGMREFAPHGDLEQRIGLMRTFGWDRLPPQTNPDPRGHEALFDGFSDLARLRREINAGR